MKLTWLVVDHSVFVGYHLSVTLCTEEPYSLAAADGACA